MPNYSRTQYLILTRIFYIFTSINVQGNKFKHLSLKISLCCCYEVSVNDKSMIKHGYKFYNTGSAFIEYKSWNSANKHLWMSTEAVHFRIPNISDVLTSQKRRYNAYKLLQLVIHVGRYIVKNNYAFPDPAICNSSRILEFLNLKAIKKIAWRLGYYCKEHQVVSTRNYFLSSSGKLIPSSF